MVMGAGLGLSLYTLVSPPHRQPPTPRAWQANITAGAGVVGPVALRMPSGESATVPHVGSHPGRQLSPSAPVRILIPALRISSPLGMARGLQPTGAVADAPLSGPTWSLPWWYSGGPVPGQDGSAVILGHVDSAVGVGHLGVFFSLGKLRPRQTITVLEVNATVTQWMVTSTRLYANGNFPNAAVYDPTGAPTLHLVTCGGIYNWRTHHYESAVVATAQLVSVS